MNSIAVLRMPSMANALSGRGVTFGPFLLLPDQQLLLDFGKPVRLGARALAILTVLVEHAGDLVSKDDLIKSVWPNTFVQESNPKVHVATLRQILRDGRDGNRYVVNVSSRGYRFVAAVSLTEALPIASSHSAVARLHNLPAALTRVVGRADVIAATAALISQRRFVTVVGPGGIGKITVALGSPTQPSPIRTAGYSRTSRLLAIPCFYRVPWHPCSVLRFIQKVRFHTCSTSSRTSRF